MRDNPNNPPPPDDTGDETQYIPPERRQMPDPTRPVPPQSGNNDPTRAFVRPPEPQNAQQPSPRNSQPPNDPQNDPTRYVPPITPNPQPSPQPNYGRQPTNPNAYDAYGNQPTRQDPDVVVPQAPYAPPPRQQYPPQQPPNYGRQPDPYAPPPQPEVYAPPPAYDRSNSIEPAAYPEPDTRQRGRIGAPIAMGMGAVLLLAIVGVVFFIANNVTNRTVTGAATATANTAGVISPLTTLSQATLVPTLSPIPGIATVTPPVIGLATATPLATAAKPTSAPATATSATKPTVTSAPALPTNPPATATKAAAPATTAPSNGTAAPGTPLPTIPTSAQDLAIFEQIKKQVADERGLPLKSDVPVSVISKETFQQYNKESTQKDTPPEQLDKQKKILVALRFVDPSFDYVNAITDLYGGLVLGFYVPKENHFYIVNNGDQQAISNALNRATAAHEMTHAVQNQNYNLETWQADQSKQPLDQHNDDLYLAKLAVSEGDAELMRTQWMNKHFSALDQAQYVQQSATVASADDIAKLSKLPPFFIDQLQFPYSVGLSFMQSLYKQGGWNTVNRAWTNKIPQSTTEILHLSKYLTGFSPQSVSAQSVTGALGSDWKTVDINVMGELQMREWLQNRSNTGSQAATAAAGWLGDRYEVVEGPNSALGTILDTVWEDSKNAGEFVDAAARLAGSVTGAQGSGNDTRRSFTGNNQTIIIARKGTSVAVTIMPTADLADKALKARGY